MTRAVGSRETGRGRSVWLLLAASGAIGFSALSLALLYRSAYSGLHTSLRTTVTHVDTVSPAERAGLRPGDRLLELDGKAIHGVAELFLVRRAIQPHRPAAFAVERAGEKVQGEITFIPYGQLGSAALGFGVGLVLLAVGLLAARLHPRLRWAQLLGLTGCAVLPSLTIVSEWYQLMPCTWLIQLWIIPLLIMPPLTLHLSLSYPRERAWMQRMPWLVYLTYLPAAMFLFHLEVRSFSVYRDFSVGESVVDAAFFSDVFQSAIVYATLSLLYFAAEPVLHFQAYRRARPGAEKLWVGVVFLGGLLALALGLPVFVSAMGRLDEVFSGLFRIDLVMAGVVVITLGWLAAVLQPEAILGGGSWGRVLLWTSLAFSLTILAVGGALLLEEWSPPGPTLRVALRAVLLVGVALAGVGLRSVLEARFLEGEAGTLAEPLLNGGGLAAGAAATAGSQAEKLGLPRITVALVGPRPPESWLSAVAAHMRVETIESLGRLSDGRGSRGYDLVVVEETSGSVTVGRSGGLPTAHLGVPNLRDLSPEDFVMRVYVRLAADRLVDVDGRYALVTANARLREILDFVKTRVGGLDAPVLITGESGTGKELLARFAHRYSRRSAGPFVPVNCSALAPGVLESELFGHEKGAFTGAVQRRVGKFESAHTGTLFLDEFADLRPEIQVKLLRVLQDRTIERVGGNEAIPIDVRIIAATNREIKALVKEGAFREDLFYRLNGIPLHLPALRERREDVPFLIAHLLDEFNRRYGRKVWMPEPTDLVRYQAYAWLGNVRELENWISRAASAAGDQEPLPFSSDAPSGAVADTPLCLYDEAIRDATVSLIVKALRTTGGNVKEASRLIGMEYNKMRREIRRYGIDVEQVVAASGPS
ncbi:MAG: sigma 54-interacting transcriptional regulator [Nitrospirae bacterium]|nr:sigma 54-interacting transcriptional regulator [Nitrospirota bacterium]